MTKPTASICPNCSNKPMFIASEGRRVQVLCGHSVCQAAMEARITAHVVATTNRHHALGEARELADRLLEGTAFQRLMGAIMRHLPPDIIRGAKR